MAARTGRVGAAVAALRDAFGNPNLRRLELTWAAAITTEWSFEVALAVYAYTAGGVLAVGIVGLVRTIPAFFSASFASLVADRYPRERVLLTVVLARAAAVGGAAALAFGGAPAAAVYAIAAVDAAAHTLYWPTQAALLPLVATTPEELTAANVAYGTIGGIGALVGPAATGALLAFTGDGPVFAASAAVLLLGALPALRIESPRIERRPEAGAAPLHRRALAGFAALRRDANARVVLLLYVAEALVWGAFSVLVVPAAVHLLRLGRPGVGYLNSMLGVGSVIGSVATLALVGRRRLAAPFGWGVVLWGLPILVLGIVPWPPASFVLIAMTGLATTVVDVAGLTLLQRIVPEHVLARVMGILEGAWWGASGIGMIAASGLSALLGTRWSLAIDGALLPVAVALAVPRLRAIDRAAAVREREVGLLRALPIFAPLPVPTVEHLARRLTRTEVAAGTVVIREGEPGDCFYVIGAGEADVSRGGRPIRTMGPGEGFGEVALLGNVPRTATVAARTPMVLFGLERDEFVGSVTGHPASRRAADAVVSARLASVRERGALP